MQKSFLSISAIIMLGGLLPLNAATNSITGKQGSKPAGGAPPPVEVALAVRKDVSNVWSTFGLAHPHASVAVKSQVNGELKTVYFKEGQDVRQGEILLTLDARPFDATLREVIARWEQNKIQLENAEKEYQRQTNLLAKGFASQDVCDQASTAAQSLRAATAASAAAVDNSRLQLEYCTIRSPINGRAGDLRVQAGNLIKANDEVLVTVNMISPIEVEFAAPQQLLPDVMQGGSNKALQVTATVPGTETVETGDLSMVDNAVDSATGTFQIKAIFANKEQRMWPGLFVNVAMTIEMETNVVVVPVSAVLKGQQGDFVYVVRPDDTVEFRPLTVRRKVGEDAVISKGLKGDESVVVEGQLRLGPDMKVKVKKAEQTTPSSRP